jgi:hypothetical protein
MAVNPAPTGTPVTASAGEVGCLGIAVGPGTSVGPGDQCGSRGDQCGCPGHRRPVYARVSRQHGSGHLVEQLGRCGSSGVVHGPWIDRERGRESPTGRRCVLATRVGKHFSTGWCVRKSRMVSGKEWSALESPRSEIRARQRESFAERKVFTEVQHTDPHGIRRRICTGLGEGFTRKIEGLSRKESERGREFSWRIWKLKSGGLV